MTTVADVINAPSADALFDRLVATCASLGFPVTAWQSGGAGRTLLRADAAALRDLYELLTAVIRGGYLDEAEGPWLTLLAASVFALDRRPALFASGTVTLQAAAGVGPYSLSAAAVVVSDGVRFWRATNADARTLPSAGTVTLPVSAEGVGPDWNSLAAATSITSPALAGVTIASAALVIAGAAEESDAQLRQRCRDRWSTLGRGATASAYRFWALSAPEQDAVRRAQVVAGPGDGTVLIYIAQSATTATAPQVTAVQAFIDTQHPLTDAPTVSAAALITVAVTATIMVRAASDSTANRALATDAVTALFASDEIGAPVDREAIAAALYQARGLVDVGLSAPAVDVAVGEGQVAALGTVTLTWTVVP